MGVVAKGLWGRKEKMEEKMGDQPCLVCGSWSGYAAIRELEEEMMEGKKKR